MVCAWAGTKESRVSIHGLSFGVVTVRPLVALAFDEGHIDSPTQHGMQLDFSLQRIDERLGRFTDGSLPRNVERLRIVIQALKDLE
jgi:hypothetical protein